MIDVNRNPSRRDLRIFAGLWLVFFVLLGLLAWFKPQALVVAATVLGTAWLVSLAFNPANRLAQLSGVAMPALFGAVGGSVLAGVGVEVVASALGAVAVLGALLIFAVPAAGRAIYVGWMVAAGPVGWTISHVILGAVYYLVVTPLALVMRLVSYDPLKRRLDKDASTYWVERKPTSDPARYFRQF